MTTEILVRDAHGDLKAKLSPHMFVKLLEHRQLVASARRITGRKVFEVAQDLILGDTVFCNGHAMAGVEGNVQLFLWKTDTIHFMEA